MFHLDMTSLSRGNLFHLTDVKEISFLLSLETVFGIPGIGSAVIDTVIRRDYPVVQSLAMLFIFIIMLANLFVDISYGFFDPRIKYS